MLCVPELDPVVVQLQELHPDLADLLNIPRGFFRVVIECFPKVFVGMVQVIRLLVEPSQLAVEAQSSLRGQ